MPFKLVDKKGVNKLWVDEGLPPDKLSIHITTVPAGQRAHAAHHHDGVDSFFMLEGQGTMETAGERITLRANEGIIIEPSIEHGLVNTGDVPMRYMVIIAK